MWWHSSFLNANCVLKYEWTGALVGQAGDPLASQYDPTQHFTHRLPRHAGPLREGLSLCKPFILFQTVCPQPSTIQFAHSSVPSSDHWRKAMWEPVWYTKHPKPDRPAQMYTRVLFKQCIVLQACPGVCASAILTCRVALHVNDAFRFHVHLPGIKGTNANRNFHRSPRHGGGFGLLPSKNPCISLLKENKCK